MSCSIKVSGEEDRRWEYFFDGDHKCQIKSVIHFKCQNGRHTTNMVPKGLTVVTITLPDPLLQACSHSEEAETEEEDQHRFNFKVY